MFTLATKFRPEPSAFALAQQAGFEGAELWLDAEVLAGWSDVVREAGAHPLRYALHFPTRLEQSPATLDHTAALYQGIGARALVIHQPHADRHGAALLARSPDLRLAIENHRLTPSELERWAEASPGLALDVEHLWMYTWPNHDQRTFLENVRAFLERWSSKLRHVHMPGYLPGQPEHRPMYCSRDLVLEMFSIFADVGFEELVVSEVNPEFQNPFELRMDVLLYESWRHGRL